MCYSSLFPFRLYVVEVIESRIAVVSKFYVEPKFSERIKQWIHNNIALYSIKLVDNAFIPVKTLFSQQEIGNFYLINLFY